jgi:hypothetical protein
MLLGTNGGYMASRIRILCTIVVAGIVLSSCRTDPWALSNSQAKKRIEQIWREGVIVIPVGRLSAVREAMGGRPPDRSKGEVSLTEFQNLRIWEQIGVVKIAEVHDLSKGFNGWNDWFALTQSGTQVRFVSSEGPRAAELHCTESQRTRIGRGWGQTSVLCIPDGAASVDRIVQNDLHPIGADHYRAIIGTHTWTPSPMMAEYFKKTGQEPKRERKFMAALKFDPFASVWDLVTADIASRDSEFQTHTVTNLLVAK